MFISLKIVREASRPEDAVPSVEHQRDRCSSPLGGTYSTSKRYDCTVYIVVAKQSLFMNETLSCSETFLVVVEWACVQTLDSRMWSHAHLDTRSPFLIGHVLQLFLIGHVRNRFSLAMCSMVSHWPCA